MIFVSVLDILTLRDIIQFFFYFNEKFIIKFIIFIYLILI